jgi:hypothetical protein
VESHIPEGSASGAIVHQLWYEDEMSVALKYRLVREKKVQGVMIWALGYDRGRAELWNAIRDELGGTACTDGGTIDAPPVVARSGCSTSGGQVA